MQDIIDQVTNEGIEIQNKINIIDAIQTSNSELLTLYANKRIKLIDDYRTNQILLSSLQSTQNALIESQNVQFSSIQQQIINDNNLSNDQIEKLKYMNESDRLNYFRLMGKCECANSKCALTDIMLN